MLDRIKRTFKFYKLLTYGAWSWWIPIPSQDRDYAGEHTILADKESYGKTGWRLKIRKLKVAWYLAGEYILNNDGLYRILGKRNGELVLYKKSL